MSEIEFVGKAIEIEEDKTYVIEIDHQISLEEAQVIQTMWKKMSDSKIIILAGGAKVARSSEAELREKIAKEIETNDELLEDAKKLGSDAYLIAHRSRMACAAIVRGLVK